VFISCVVATILHPPLKGKNIAMDEQDKTYTDPTVAETVSTYAAPPAEVTVEKEAEAAAPAEVTVEKEVAPPPIEVTEVTVEKEAKAANGMRVGVRIKFVRVRIGLGLRLGLGIMLRGQEANDNKARKTSSTEKRTKWANDKEARKIGDKDEILEWTHQLHQGKRSTIFHLIVYISCVSCNHPYLPLKGENIAMDEQDKGNTEPAISETVDTYLAPPAVVTAEKEAGKEAEAAAPAEVTMEKEAEAEAAPPPTEVIQRGMANGMRVRVRFKWVRVRIGVGLRLG
jgi:hypothetical protein